MKAKKKRVARSRFKGAERMRLLREHIIIFFQHLRQWSPGISLVLAGLFIPICSVPLCMRPLLSTAAESIYRHLFSTL